MSQCSGDTYVAECRVAFYSHVPDMHLFKEGLSNSHRRDWKLGNSTPKQPGRPSEAVFGILLSLSGESVQCNARCQGVLFKKKQFQTIWTLTISVRVTQVYLFWWPLSWFQSPNTININRECPFLWRIQHTHTHNWYTQLGHLLFYNLDVEHKDNKK